MSGHVIETQLVRTCKRPYSSRFAENHGSVVDERHTFCLSFSLKFHATDCVILICTPNVHETWRFYSVVRIPTSSDEIPWYVKFPVFSLARDSMVRVISHTQKPGNSTVHEITDVEIVAKLPDTRKLQHVYCTKFDDTFNFHAWYWKNWYRLFTPLIPHDMFPGQHCTSLHFRDLFVGLQYYTENDF